MDLPAILTVAIFIFTGMILCLSRRLFGNNNADDLDIQNQIDGLVTVTGGQQVQLNVLMASVISHGNRMDSLQTELRELSDRVNETDALLKRSIGAKRATRSRSSRQ